MRKLLSTAVLAAMMGGVTFIAGPVSAAPGGAVARYQFESLTITVALGGTSATSGNVHVYTATLNPCDNTFTGTGGGYLGLSATTPYVTESVTGTYSGYFLTLNSTYDGNQYGNPYTYTLGPVSVTSADTPSTVDTYSSGNPAGTYSVDVTVVATTTSSWVNHGAFVSANPGSTAAQSCIGMPM